jgi:hypothetical protein
MCKIYCDSCKYHCDIISPRGSAVTRWVDYDNKNNVRHLCVNPSEYRETAVSVRGEYLYTDCEVKNADNDCYGYRSKEEELNRKRVIQDEKDYIKRINERTEENLAKHEQYKNDVRKRDIQKLILELEQEQAEFLKKKGLCERIKRIFIC